MESGLDDGDEDDEEEESQDDGTKNKPFGFTGEFLGQVMLSIFKMFLRGARVKDGDDAWNERNCKNENFWGDI